MQGAQPPQVRAGERENPRDMPTRNWSAGAVPRALLLLSPRLHASQVSAGPSSWDLPPLYALRAVCAFPTLPRKGRNLLHRRGWTPMESPWGRDLQDQEWDVSFQVKAHPTGPQEAIPLPEGGVARGSGAGPGGRNRLRVPPRRERGPQCTERSGLLGTLSTALDTSHVPLVTFSLGRLLRAIPRCSVLSQAWGLGEGNPDGLALHCRPVGHLFPVRVQDAKAERELGCSGARGQEKAEMDLRPSVTLKPLFFYFAILPPAHSV